MATWQTQVDHLIRPSVAKSNATEVVLISSGAVQSVGDIAAGLTLKRQALVMADHAGFAAAGEQVMTSLREAGFQIDTIILPSNPLPKAAVEEAEPFRARLAENPDLFPISVGSGVINDLVKYAAFETIGAI